MTTATAILIDDLLPQGRRQLSRYPETSDSAIPFVQRLPSHWRVEKLKYVASVRFSSVDKKMEEGESPVRLCNYTDVYNRDTILDDPEFMQASATSAEIFRHTLKKGDVLITKDSEAWNDIAVPAYVTADMPGVLCGYHLAHIRPNPSELDGAFLSRAFAADGTRQQFHIAANGITRYGLPNRAIAGALFPIPPLEEQRAIAEFLDRETSKIDQLIGKKERISQLLTEKIRATQSLAVTLGNTSISARVKTDSPWLPFCPPSWQILPLRRVLKWIEQGWSPSCDGKEADLDEWGVLKAGCVNSGELDESENKTLISDMMPDLSLQICPGDVLMSRACGTASLVGSVAFVKTCRSKLLLCDKVFRLHPNTSRILPQFLAEALKSKSSRTQIEQSLSGADGLANNITQATIKKIVIAVPPLTEQKDICETIDQTRTQVLDLIRAVQAAIRRLRQYRSALISAAVTGQIDVRNYRPEAPCH
jgi:type I restriction enzyme, S subunit